MLYDKRRTYDRRKGTEFRHNRVHLDLSIREGKCEALVHHAMYGANVLIVRTAGPCLAPCYFLEGNLCDLRRRQIL